MTKLLARKSPERAGQVLAFSISLLLALGAGRAHALGACSGEASAATSARTALKAATAQRGKAASALERVNRTFTADSKKAQDGAGRCLAAHLRKQADYERSRARLEERIRGQRESLAELRARNARPEDIRFRETELARSERVLQALEAGYARADASLTKSCSAQALGFERKLARDRTRLEEATQALAATQQRYDTAAQRVQETEAALSACLQTIR